MELFRSIRLFHSKRPYQKSANHSPMILLFLKFRSSTYFPFLPPNNPDHSVEALTETSWLLKSSEIVNFNSAEAYFIRN